MPFVRAPKNEKSITAKTLPPKNYPRIALPPKKYRHILVYRFRQSRYRQKMKNRQPPKNYRRIALPPENYRHILLYRFRQSRYRQKRENRQPPKNYRRMAIPPRLCPPKNRYRRPPWLFLFFTFSHQFWIWATAVVSLHSLYSILVDYSFCSVKFHVSFFPSH